MSGAQLPDIGAHAVMKGAGERAFVLVLGVQQARMIQGLERQPHVERVGQRRERIDGPRFGQGGRSCALAPSGPLGRPHVENGTDEENRR